MNKRINIHVLCEYSGGAMHDVAAIRLLIPLQMLRDMGMLTLTYGQYYQENLGADVFIVERTWRDDIDNDEVEAFLAYVRTSGKKLIYELDDNLLDHPGFSNKTKHIIRYLSMRADLVIVSTQLLKERILHLNQRVIVIPNTLNLKQIEGKAFQPNLDSRVVIGYMGTYTHQRDFAMIQLPLLKLLMRYPQFVRLEIVGCLEKSTILHGLSNVKILDVGENFHYYDFWEWMKSNLHWDIGIAPLKTDSFTKCKSDIKFLDYAAIGCCGIFSDHPAYSDTVRDGENGMLCSDSQDEWFEKMETLILNEQLRINLLKAARADLYEKRLTGNVLGLWVSALDLYGFTDLLLVRNGFESETESICFNLKEQLRKGNLYATIIDTSQLCPQVLKYCRGVILIGTETISAVSTEVSESCKRHNKKIFLGSSAGNTSNLPEWVCGVFATDTVTADAWNKAGYPSDATTDQAHEPLVTFIRSCLAINMAFVLPGLSEAGGVHVTLKHCASLIEHGVDAFIISLCGDDDILYFDNNELYVFGGNATTISGSIDKMAATMWSTIRYLDQCPMVSEKYYLVQGYEPDFYEEDELRQQVKLTYQRDDLHYVTVSPWCQDWLLSEFGRNAALVLNGISTEQFKFRKRTFTGKIRILIEGSCDQVSKNLDEAFKIVEYLDRRKYEVILLTNSGTPKNWYHYDSLLTSVSYSKVQTVYQGADILLKTSLLESFSYPPLEMMATGGLVVAIQNEGNKVYLKDFYNSLIFEHGNLTAAIQCIERLSTDEELREALVKNGLETVRRFSWDAIIEQMLLAYGM